MGADLSIRSVYEPNRKKWEPVFNASVARRDAPSTTDKAKAQAEVDLAYEGMCPQLGYFRDSYNRTSLLNVLGLSWWQDVNTDGVNIKDVEWLRAEVVLRQVPGVEHFASWEGTTKPDEWRTYFLEKRARLIAFLTYAIILGEPVEASL